MAFTGLRYLPGERVSCSSEPLGMDTYGRIPADVRLFDGSHVSHTLAKDGWCWWYRKYAPRNTELERLEKAAREAKKGL